MKKDFDERLLNVDEYGCVQPGASFWLAMFVLTRCWILMAFMLISGQWSIGVEYVFGGTVSMLPVLGELPAIALLLVGARRTPGVSVIFRWVWRWAPIWALATAAAHALWMVQFYLANDLDMPRHLVLMLAGVLLDVGIVVAFFASPFFRTLFREFPEH